MTIATTSSTASTLLLLANAGRTGSSSPDLPSAIVVPPQPVTVSAVPSQARVEAMGRIAEALTVEGPVATAETAEGPVATAETAEGPVTDAETDERPGWVIYFEWLFDPNREKPVLSAEERARMRVASERKAFASHALGASNAKLLTAQMGNFGSAEEAAEAMSVARRWMRDGLAFMNEVVTKGDATLQGYSRLDDEAQALYEKYRNPELKLQYGMDTYRIGEALMRNLIGVDGDTLVKGEDGRYSIKPIEVEIAGQMLSIGDRGKITIYPKPEG